jgi:hypothetical protein
VDLTIRSEIGPFLAPSSRTGGKEGAALGFAVDFPFWEAVYESVIREREWVQHTGTDLPLYLHKSYREVEIIPAQVL